MRIYFRAKAATRQNVIMLESLSFDDRRFIEKSPNISIGAMCIPDIPNENYYPDLRFDFECMIAKELDRCRRREYLGSGAQNATFACCIIQDNFMYMVDSGSNFDYSVTDTRKISKRTASRLIKYLKKYKSGERMWWL